MARVNSGWQSRAPWLRWLLSLPLAALASLLGLLGFAVLELLSFLRGGYYFPLTNPVEILIVALAFVGSSLLSTLLFRRPLAWAKGWRLLLIALPFLIFMGLLAGVLEGMLLLSYYGSWLSLDAISMHLLYVPINFLVELASLGYVSLPAGFAGTWLLQKRCTRA